MEAPDTLPEGAAARDRAPAGMRVAHVLSSLNLGGQERVALDLATAQRLAGCEVRVISLAPPPDGPLEPQFRAAGVEPHTAGRHAGFDPWLWLRVAALLRRHRVELVHTHNPSALIYGAPAAALAGAACVHTKHGGMSPSKPRKLRAARLAARFTQAFVAVSPTTAELARRRHEVAEAKLVVIDNGVDVTRFSPDPAARARVREELGIPADAWVVGTVGRLAKEKNQQLLVRAMAPLLGGGARLLLIGDGPLRGDLAALASSLGVARQVLLTGVRTDVPAVINALDVFALSSKVEALPLVIPEAMATGRPVVSTAVGGIATVIDEGVTGFLVPSEDEAALRDRLARLRDTPGLQQALGQRARIAAVERFSAERMQREYLDLYHRVLAARGRRAATG